MNSYYILIASLTILILFIAWKYIFGEPRTKDYNAMNEAKHIIHSSWKNFLDLISFGKKRSFQFSLHFLVIFLGKMSDSIDRLYTKSRDLFLDTATKEKALVTRFWGHLKEYKKEVDGIKK
jgi:hypothetical protein